MALRRLGCKHVLDLDMPHGDPIRVAVALSNANFMAEALLCGHCRDAFHLNARVVVKPVEPMVYDEHGKPDRIPFSITRAVAQSGGKMPVEPRKEPDNVTKLVNIDGHHVTLNADPRLRDRELVAWTKLFVAGDVTPGAFRKIALAVEKGPAPLTGGPGTMTFPQDRRTSTQVETARRVDRIHRHRQLSAAVHQVVLARTARNAAVGPTARKAAEKVLGTAKRALAELAPHHPELSESTCAGHLMLQQPPKRPRTKPVRISVG